jgi:RNA polymerase sigma-70 factor (ECF subfamily)
VGHREHGRLADEELMALVVAMDADAFETLYDRHIDIAYALAYRVCGDAAGADEACQDAMLDVWRRARRYQPHLGSPRSWILTVVHHRAVDHVRRRGRVDARQLSDDDAAERVAGGEDVEARVLRDAQGEEVQGALAGLPDDQREVIRLAYYGGYSQTEIAASLGLPLGTVKSRMRLALEKLRRGLGEGAAHA